MSFLHQEAAPIIRTARLTPLSTTIIPLATTTTSTIIALATTATKSIATTITKPTTATITLQATRGLPQKFYPPH